MVRSISADTGRHSKLSRSGFDRIKIMQTDYVNASIEQSGDKCAVRSQSLHFSVVASTRHRFLYLRRGHSPRKTSVFSPSQGCHDADLILPCHPATMPTKPLTLTQSGKRIGISTLYLFTTMNATTSVNLSISLRPWKGRYAIQPILDGCWRFCVARAHRG